MSLFDYMDTNKDIPFEWGENDCLSFVNGALRAQGCDGLPSEWAGDYSTAWGAARHYARLLDITGYDDIVEAVDDLFTRVLTLHPVEGSIVARPADGEVLGFAFGVVYRDHVIFRTEGGIGVDQIRHCDIFWNAT